MYKNLKQVGIGEFKDEWYWSSSQYDSNYYKAWSQYFGNGYQDYLYKDNTYRVRAVRAF